MRIKRFLALFLTIGLVLALAAGCATTKPAEDTAKAASQTDWKFHDIVDVNFVMQNISVPMAEDIRHSEARPKRAKYEKGHIPGESSIHESQLAKMTAQLPSQKDTLLIFYCEGPT